MMAAVESDVKEFELTLSPCLHAELKLSAINRDEEQETQQRRSQKMAVAAYFPSTEIM